MTIHLTKDLEQFVHDAVRAGQYASEDDVVDDAVDRLRRAIPKAGVVADQPPLAEKTSNQKTQYGHGSRTATAHAGYWLDEPTSRYGLRLRRSRRPANRN